MTTKTICQRWGKLELDPNAELRRLDKGDRRLSFIYKKGWYIPKPKWTNENKSKDQKIRVANETAKQSAKFKLKMLNKKIKNPRRHTKGDTGGTQGPTGTSHQQKQTDEEWMGNNELYTDTDEEMRSRWAERGGRRTGEITRGKHGGEITAADRGRQTCNKETTEEEHRRHWPSFIKRTYGRKTCVRPFPRKL